ncbi:MAG: beta-galactosidase [Muribaculaceae bacterium]|nr:beta-galactosidase [Muribaculaceae bacterium]
MKKLISNLLRGAGFSIAALFSLSLAGCGSGNGNFETRTFEIGQGTFLRNGEPFVIKAAELHYPRIPKEYWDQRIKLSKALGMNTVCLYTFWNVHEPKEGQFDFSGQNDIRGFIELCKDNGLNVILRPGPYVCAEWEMGGLPWWLLKKKDIQLRDNDPYFLERVDEFQKALAQQVGDLTLAKGGPIIMIQVENEYGSYGENKEYVSNIRDMLRKNFGEDIVMFQCDWSSNFTLNGLDDLVWTMNFGTGADVDSQFAKLKELRPESPLMCSEFWSGWFDKWGAAHETRPADEMIKGIDDMLSRGISFSLYMTHGGTNWGHWAGANSPGYAPDVTSYDYDAPISESGQTTEKYWALRDLLAKYSDGKPLAEVPALIEPVSIDQFSFSEFAPIYVPQPKVSEEIMTMEDFDQGFGSIAYETKLPAIKEGTILSVNEPHDFAQIFINDKYVGKLDRRYGETELTLGKYPEGSKLVILVEAMGRINFGVAIKDYKGITSSVSLNYNSNGKESSEELNGWKVYLIPDEMSFYEGLKFQSVSSIAKGENGRYPRGAYKGKFNVEKPSDTFLLFETWGKGLVYVNGHPLGRIWDIGPQQTLYTPGTWLKEGENEILVFDILGPKEITSQGLTSHIIDKLQGEALKKHRQEGETLTFGNLTPVFGGSFPTGNGWKRQEFEKPVEGKYIAIEALSPVKEGDNLAIAEFYVLDAQGKKISRESWTVYYADSEDTDSGNFTADKMFDLQESTYWKTEDTTTYPHVVVIDLGKEEEIKGIEYLPRAENGAPGAIQDYRIFVSPTPFKK